MPGGVDAAVAGEELGDLAGVQVAGEGQGEQNRKADLLLARLLLEPGLERVAASVGEPVVAPVAGPTSLASISPATAIEASSRDAPVVLSVRESARTWWESAEDTILPPARTSAAADWSQGSGLTDLMRKFTDTLD